MITFKTGRTYNGPQVLEIVVAPLEAADEFGFYPAKVLFMDASRGISGTFVTMMRAEESAKDTGRHVLTMYNEGRYTLV